MSSGSFSESFREMLKDRLPTVVTVTVAAVATDAAFTFSRQWLRRRHLAHRIAWGSYTEHSDPLPGHSEDCVSCGPGSNSSSHMSTGTASVQEQQVPPTPDSGGGSATTPRGAMKRGRRARGASLTSTGHVMFAEPAPTALGAQDASGARGWATISRDGERKRIIDMLMERGLYTAFVGDPGRGVSSLLRSAARSRKGISYITLNGAETLADVARVFREEFGLSTTAVRSPLGYIAQRLLVVMAQADSGSLPDDNDEDDDDDDDAKAWRAIQRAFGEVLGTIATQRSQHNRRAARSGGRSTPPDFDLPVLICDHVSTLNHEALMALQSWASMLATRGWMHVAFVSEQPITLFATGSVANLRVAHIPDPSASSIVDLLRRRCPAMSPSLASRLVADICGTSIGLAHRVTILHRELTTNPISMYTLQSLLPTIPVEFTDEATLGTHEHDSTYQYILRAMLQQVFAHSRPLHLYSCQATGDKELDETRLAIFLITLRILRQEDHERGLGTCGSEVSTPTMGLPQLSTMSNESTSSFCVDVPIGISFKDALGVIPLRVFMNAVEIRPQLPFAIAFDVLRFRSPLHRKQLLWTLGMPGSPRRRDAMRELQTMLERYADDDWRYCQSEQLITNAASAKPSPQLHGMTGAPVPAHEGLEYGPQREASMCEFPVTSDGSLRQKLSPPSDAAAATSEPEELETEGGDDEVIHSP